jgi:hypothetical protein
MNFEQYYFNDLEEDELTDTECPAVIDPEEQKEERQDDLNDAQWYSTHIKPDCGYFKDAGDFLLSDLGMKPYSKRQRCMTHLLQNLVYLYRNRYGGFIKIYRNSNMWKRCNKRNPYRIGFIIISIVDAMIDAGYIEQDIGFYDRTTGISRATRIRYTQKFLDEIVSPYQLAKAPIEFQSRETYCMANIPNKNGVKFKTTIPKSEARNEIDAVMAAYNDLLKRTDIGAYNDDGVPMVTTEVYRTYNALDMILGGRFYGG